MKKRLMALFMTLILCLSMMSANAFAFSTEAVSSQAVVNREQSVIAASNFSQWAQNDLIVGDSYGVYPLTWYNKDMTAPISHGQLRIILGKLRGKILNTDRITKIKESICEINDEKITVEEVLKAYYSVLSDYEFTKDIGLKSSKAVDFMKKNKIYTGTNGELKLKDTCSVEQACVMAARLVTFLYDTLDAGSKGFFWETSYGDNKVYLLGSIHIASNDIYPYSKKIQSAFESSDALVVELNMLDTSGAIKVAEYGLLTDGTTLKDHLSPEVYEKTIALAKHFGYPEEIINMYKPWLVNTLFSAYTSTDTASQDELVAAANLGIDLHFTINASLTGKKILEVEGYEVQYKALDSFSPELDEYLLNSTVDTINGILAGQKSSGSEFVDDALLLWRKGDVETFSQYTSFEYMYKDLVEMAATEEELNLLKEYEDKLLLQRDKGMADYIDNLLKAEGSNTYFVVVGSAHYISDYSVLDRLEEKGYTITQIK